MSALDWIAAVLVVSGSLLVLAAALGVLRLPDVFARMHAATKAATLGFLAVITATALVLPVSEHITQLALAGLFQLLTAPVAAHMIGRAAHRAGTELSPTTVRDDLTAFERGT